MTIRFDYRSHFILVLSICNSLKINFLQDLNLTLFNIYSLQSECESKSTLYFRLLPTIFHVAKPFF